MTTSTCDRSCVERLVFLCLPLFTGPEHVLRSKHFRPEEHCWYWTRDGLLWKPEHCQRCGEATPTELLHGHHHNGYARVEWFNVRWLCVPCHVKEEGRWGVQLHR